MAALIGNRRHAAIVNEASESFGEQQTLPIDGFRLLDRGSFRAAYLHEKTGVVYKAPIKRKSTNPDYTNEAELRNARALRRLAYADGFWSTYVRIPKVSGFKFGERTIVAMEYVRGLLGRDAEMSPLAWAELYSLGLEDIHGSNFMVDTDGYVVPIDLGSECFPSDKVRIQNWF